MEPQTWFMPYLGLDKSLLPPHSLSYKYIATIYSLSVVKPNRRFSVGLSKWPNAWAVKSPVISMGWNSPGMESPAYLGVNRQHPFGVRDFEWNIEGWRTLDILGEGYWIFKNGVLFGLSSVTIFFSCICMLSYIYLL